MSTTRGISSWRSRWERLTERERRMLAVLGVLAGLVVVGMTAYLINDGLTTLEEENASMRQALDDIEQGRGGYQSAKTKTALLESKIGRGSVQLGGFLETAAKEAGVEITETTERQPAPAGAKYIEKAVEVRLRTVNLDGLTKFLRKIETGPNLVVVTALNVRSIDDKHENLAVEMVVSTYEHAPAEKPGKKKENKG